MGPEEKESTVLQALSNLEDAVSLAESQLDYGAAIGTISPSPANPKASAKLQDVRNRIIDLSHRVEIIGDRLRLIG